jgi:hypothetical protein
MGMSLVMQPWHLLLAILAGWVNRRQAEAIDYLRAENEVLRELLGKQRILLNDNQRRRLAAKGHILGRKRMLELGSLFTPDTILRWHRDLVAAKWGYSHRRSIPGRPSVSHDIQALVLRMARENPNWGYDRIQGALKNLGHDVSDQTVGNILKQHGVEPAPQRKRSCSAGSWKTFLKSHWDVIGAIDFTTVEVWTAQGLVTYYVLFAMNLATRKVHFAGCTPHPTDAWMRQTARQLTDACDGFLRGTRYLLMDRDGSFSEGFRNILKSAGVEPVRLPPRSPNLRSSKDSTGRSNPNLIE